MKYPLDKWGFKVWVELPQLLLAFVSKAEPEECIWRVLCVAIMYTNESGSRLLERHLPWNRRRAALMRDLLSVSSKTLLSLAMSLKSFRECFDTY